MRHIVVMIMIVLMFYVKSVADPPVNYWLLLHSFDLNVSQKCGEHYNMNTLCIHSHFVPNLTITEFNLLFIASPSHIKY